MAWYKESVFYHIYPLGLLDAPKKNEYGEVVHRLRELDKWIGHVKKLGCNAIYIGPLFESVGHGYETTDYKKLDSRLGDNEDLKNFVVNCHKEGIRVIFDGVFNHTGRDFFAFKDIQKNREHSRYKDWYCNVNFGGNNEYNDGFSYDNWGGYNLLAKLNQRNDEVKNYICDVIKFWVSEFDVDGIRLDAADVLDFDFMKALRSVSDTVKPDFWLMGEVIHGDYSRWVNNNTLHSVTNYVLHKGLYSGHNDHNYFEIAHTVKRLSDLFSNDWNKISLYNFTDNHDVERIYTKLSNKANFYPLHILEYTLPGVPSIYYGSEFGIEGRKEKGSDDSLRPYLKYENYKDAIKKNSYTMLISALGNMRLAFKSLSYGDYKEVSLKNRQYMFTRNTDKYTCIVAVNNDDNPVTIDGNGIKDGTYIGILQGKKIKVQGGHVVVSIPANYGEVWISEEEYLEGNHEFKPIKVEKEKIKTKISNVVHDVIKKESNNKDETIKNKDMKNDMKKDNASMQNTKNIDKNASNKENESVDSNKNHVAKMSNKEKDSSINNETNDCIVTTKIINNASLKYGLSKEYEHIDVDVIKKRSDYEKMTIQELQVAILEKMAANGPVDEQMLNTVIVNAHKGSLLNWVRSFN